MALRRQGDYWYGETPTDVWEYFVWWTRNSCEPVKHWRQAVCECGSGVFELLMSAEEGFHERTCVECGAVHQMLREGARPRKSPEDAGPAVCICNHDEFEIVGVTAPFQGDLHSAKWFYLGLRCIHCGCLGCYDDWIPRYLDYKLYLAML
ncbi:MAG: hypothetical protein L0241_19070 [Planctomycetia bacterium]|nr:hypothetical protein [Planctomycetia bacterium]